MRDRRFVSTIAQAASSYALIDLGTLKTYLGITGTAQDAVLSLWLNAASTAAQKFTSNPFVVETRFDQYWPTHDGPPWTVRNRPDSLLLQRRPVTNPASPSLTRPPAVPVVTTASGGALAARAYYIRLSYVTAYGETAAGVELRAPVAASNLATVASPAADHYALATGWNVYAGTASGAETLQNSSPIAIGTAWTEPSTGLTAGAAMPSYALVVESHGGPNAPLPPLSTTYPANLLGGEVPLAEGVDFLIDATEGEIGRLNRSGESHGWRASYICALYTAGYAAVPPDVVETVSEMVKQRYYAQQRDPMARSVDVTGVLSTSYWFGNGPGSDTDMPPHIQARLERYRTPVIG